MSNAEIVLENKKVKKILTRQAKRKIFYYAMIILPVIQFSIFYLYINFEAISMAFQKYTINQSTGLYESKFYLGNFGKVLWRVFGEEGNYGVSMVTNALIFFVFHTGAGTILCLTFSFYIYKKYRFSEFFRVVLFMPGIVSGVVWTALFQFFLNDIYKELFNPANGKGIIENIDTRFIAIVIYSLWMGFGANILLYSGAMSGVNESLVESAALDGANFFQEFLHITLPMIFNTFSTFMITAIASIFVNQMNLYTFFGDRAEPSVQTLGYYMYINTLASDVYLSEAKAEKYLTFTELSSLGLMITAVTLPIVYGFKYCVKKFGPSVD